MSRKIRREKAVAFTDLEDGSGVLLHLDNKFYYSLNMTGSFLWKLLEEKEELSEESLLEAVVDNFEVELKEAKTDLDEFIEDLVKEGLIKIQQEKIA